MDCCGYGRSKGGVLWIKGKKEVGGVLWAREEVMVNGVLWAKRGNKGEVLRVRAESGPKVKYGTTSGSR